MEQIISIKDRINTDYYFINETIEEYCESFQVLNSCREEIEKAVMIMIECYERKGKVLVCGNGGSAADSQHIVCELMKSFKVNRKLSRINNKLTKVSKKEEYILNNLEQGLPAINLTSDMGLITAICNDINSDLIFAQQIYSLAGDNDVVILISTSGNSKNICEAAITSKLKKLKIIGLTGIDGGYLNNKCDALIKSPYDDTPRIQEVHVLIYHIICELVEKYFFDNNWEG
ncbi:D-sedoheptulose 7-phosphate isomerase [Vallitalea sediminicola]